MPVLSVKSNCLKFTGFISIIYHIPQKAYLCFMRIYWYISALIQLIVNKITNF